MSIKSYLAIILSLILFSSCHRPTRLDTSDSSSQVNDNASDTSPPNKKMIYTETIIDGCEYLVTPIDNDGHYMFVHKGNCRNHLTPEDILNIILKNQEPLPSPTASPSKPNSLKSLKVTGN